MLSHILTDTLRRLSILHNESQRRLLKLHLTRYFTVVELDDGSVGACMSYYDLPDQVLSDAERTLHDVLCDDIFLLCDERLTTEAFTRCVRGSNLQRLFVASSMTASIASALSSPVIRRGGNEAFTVASQAPAGWLDGIESALVVGFGGYLRTFAMRESVRTVHVIDLSYARRRERIEAELAIYRRRFPTKSITASCGFTKPVSYGEFDLVSITGSTLCNGTLENIVGAVRSDALVVLQGQSASLYPEAIFDAGVDWIATTVKPTTLGALAARADRNGSTLRPVLDGGALPWVYLCPRAGT
jgi:hypothetical protein